MTELKTRIKITTDGNGKTLYWPQEKGWFFWHDMRRYSSCFDGQVSYKIVRDTLEEAQQAIDTRIQARKEAARARNIRVKYVTYP